MQILNLEAQQKAKDFIFTHGRPLERARYAYHFEDGAAEAVFAELAKFQTPDGGFGHGLEPDLRLPDSSVLATTVGLQILREVAAPPDHPLVRGAMRALLHTFDPAAMAWPIIPPHTDDAPHAPWWTYSDTVAASWNHFLVNPRVEIIGYLYDYAPPGLPAWVRETLTAAAVAYPDEHPDKVQMFDLLCYDRLIKTRALPEATRKALIEKLLPLADQRVAKDPAEWEKYTLTPLELVDAPDSPFAGLLADAVAQNLDFEIAHQGNDGAWHPKWLWYGLYPDTWPTAEREWAGVITLRTLQTLRKFGRLA
ncbi:MAG TPA: hypothetical protein PKH77_06280 [Anaerolineae bacterium]|nr:hypothetical protein [Anaerolineae bacterium]